MDYPSNSNKSKEPQRPEKVIKQVTTNPVTLQNKSIGKRFKELFIGADASSVWQYVAYDVLVPAAKDMIQDAVIGGVERVLFGESASGRRSYRPAGNGYTNYNKFSSGNKAEPRRMTARGRARHDFREVVFATRPEAEATLADMYDLLSQFDMVSVGDLYGLCGVTATFADQKYGWSTLQGSRVIRAGNGYIIDLPSPEVIE